MLTTLYNTSLDLLMSVNVIQPSQHDAFIKEVYKVDNKQKIIKYLLFPDV